MRLLKVTVDYGWSGCQDTSTLEVSDDLSDEEVEELVIQEAHRIFDERMSFSWSDVDPSEVENVDE